MCASAAVQFKVKMVTADDDSVTDIVVEGDKEEIERLAKVGWLCLWSCMDPAGVLLALLVEQCAPSCMCECLH